MATKMQIGRWSAPGKHATKSQAISAYSMDTNIQGPRRREVYVPDYGNGSDSPSATDSSDDDKPLAFQKKLEIGLSSDYWYIQKVLKFVSEGDVQASLTGISVLKTMDFHKTENLAALVEVNGVELLVNLLEVNHDNCIIGGLHIMRNITQNEKIAKEAVNLGVGDSLVRLLTYNLFEVNRLAADVIANICLLRKGSRCIRMNGGIQILACMIDIPDELLFLPKEKMSIMETSVMKTAASASFALMRLSRFTKNKKVMTCEYIIPSVTRILVSGNKLLSIQLLGLIAHCSTEYLFKIAIEAEGLVGYLVGYLKKDDPQLQEQCALTLHHACEQPVVRDMVRYHGAIEMLVNLAKKNTDTVARGPLLIACMQALASAGQSGANARVMVDLGLLPLTVELIQRPDDALRVASAAAMSRCVSVDEARNQLAASGFIPILASYLLHPNQDLLMHVCQTVGECTKVPEAREEIEKHDCLRRLWSLLNSRHSKVRVRALWTIRSCLKRSSEIGELVRSLVGSLQMVLHVIANDKIDVVIAAVAVLEQVLRDKGNVGVLSELRLVQLLSDLLAASASGEPQLHRHVADAIANSCKWADNVRQFGKRGVPLRLVESLERYSQPKTVAATCRALFELASNAYNCVAIHTAGGVGLLLQVMAGGHVEAEVAAAGCLHRVRRRTFQVETRTILPPIAKH